MPRRHLTFDFLGLCPRGGAHSIKMALTEGHSRFLTSGGIAVAKTRGLSSESLTAKLM